MIFNIRGTSGSGKTTVARLVMFQFETMPIVEEKWSGEPLPYVHCSHHSGVTLSVLGRYTNVCGGCDTIKTQDQVCELIRSRAAVEHVLYEGLLCQSFSRYSKLADELGREEFHFVALNTPLDECISRIEQRRSLKGNQKPLNPQNTINKYRGVGSVTDKLDEAGYNVYRGDVLECFCYVHQLLFSERKPVLPKTFVELCQKANS